MRKVIILILSFLFISLIACAHKKDDSRIKKEDDFSKHKIVYIEIMTDNPKEGYDFPSFAFDEMNCVLLNTAYMISGEIRELKYILAILNSKLGRHLVKYYVTQLQNRQFRMLNQSVINFPIPKQQEEYRTKIVGYIDEIIANKKAGLSSEKTEMLIDQLVFSIYSLNKDEINFIMSL